MTGINTTKLGLTCTPNRLVVEPIYSGGKVGSLYIPDAYQDKRPYLGDVLGSGSNCPYPVGSRVLLRPNTGYPFTHQDREVIVLDHREVVGEVRGEDFYPRNEEVVVVPDWRAKYKQPDSLIYLPPVVTHDDWQPAKSGTVARVGNKCSEVKVGNYVLIPYKGIEVAWIDTVYYIIPEQEILAIIRDN